MGQYRISGGAKGVETGENGDSSGSGSGSYPGDGVNRAAEAEQQQWADYATEPVEEDSENHHYPDLEEAYEERTLPETREGANEGSQDSGSTEQEAFQTRADQGIPGAEAVSEWHNEDPLIPDFDEEATQEGDGEDTTVQDVAEIDGGIRAKTSESSLKMLDPPDEREGPATAAPEGQPESVSSPPDPDEVREKYIEPDTVETPPASEDSPDGGPIDPIEERRQQRLEAQAAETTGEVPDEDGPQRGNLSPQEETARARDEFRYDGMDQEVGLSARSGGSYDNPTVTEDGTSTLGGPPAHVDEEAFDAREEIDADLWELPPQSPLEMEEQFVGRSDELDQLNDELADRYEDTDPETATEAETRRTQANRTTTAEQAREARKERNKQFHFRQAYHDNRYPRERADALYEELPEGAQEIVDEKVSEIAETSRTRNNREVKTDVLDQLARGIDEKADSSIFYAANPDQREIAEALMSTPDALEDIQGRLDIAKYKEESTPELRPDEVKDVAVRYTRGQRGDVSQYETRANGVEEAHIEGVVRHVERQTPTEWTSNDQPKSQFYITSEDGKSEEAVTLTIFPGDEDVGLAASANHETSKSGRTISQTQRLPDFEEGDKVRLENVAVHSRYGGSAQLQDHSSWHVVEHGNVGSGSDDVDIHSDSEPDRRQSDQEGTEDQSESYNAVTADDPREPDPGSQAAHRAQRGLENKSGGGNASTRQLFGFLFGSPETGVYRKNGLHPPPEEMQRRRQRRQAAIERDKQSTPDPKPIEEVFGSKAEDNDE